MDELQGRPSFIPPDRKAWNSFRSVLSGRRAVFTAAKPCTPSLESGASRSLERATFVPFRGAGELLVAGISLWCRGDLSPEVNIPRGLICFSFVQDAPRMEAP